MQADLAAAHARAARNGLTLELGDTDGAPVWPSKRYAAARLIGDRGQVASFVQSYTAGDEEARERALRVCAERVYYRPDGVG